MPEPRVCPDCGNDEFTRDAAATLRLTGRYYANGLGFEEYSEERIDIDRDYDTLKCGDCGTEHDPDDLVTEDEYNGVCDECGEATLDCGGLCDNCGHYERTV
jgi:hypothetical protein